MSLQALRTLQGCHDFIASHSGSEIASQLLLDRNTCRNNGIPSLLVHALPPKADHIAREINTDLRISLPIARMQYATIVSGIKDHLANLSHSNVPASEIPEYMIPTENEYHMALKVIRYLQLPQVSALKNSHAPLDTVIQTIQAQINHGADLRTAETKPIRKKLCYMCRYSMKNSHRLYPSLCNPCGEFNVSSSALSLPENLNLLERTALVTGARVNLGYHIALRLLRCGAKVIVTSRYPFDAESRYLAEPDFAKWSSRLKIIGADFRTAKDVFALVTAVKRCLEKWDLDGNPILGILINNAAQTLTDPVQKEAENVQQEQRIANSLAENDHRGRLIFDNSYLPKVRAGNQGYLLESSERQKLLIEDAERTPEQMLQPAVVIKSSWTQQISDIPYEDVISAHSINTFVPFILLRELLPLMSKRSPKLSPSSIATPAGYVINVSSREGLFEKNPKSSAKAGLHVHTNMSKAALNMLTETEAAAAWQKHKVAVNSVDPGYMSADPLWMEMVGRANEECPIGWEDGAGRVLWPIATAERGEIVWGRFLKHFKEVEVGR